MTSDELTQQIKDKFDLLLNELNDIGGNKYYKIIYEIQADIINLKYNTWCEAHNMALKTCGININKNKETENVD